MPSFTRVVPSQLLAPMLPAQATPSPPEAFGPLATDDLVRTFCEHRDAGLCR
ncbi:MAG: hypothetical protein U1F60_00305 [Planctomycetota bacterium]